VKFGVELEVVSRSLIMMNPNPLTAAVAVAGAQVISMTTSLRLHRVEVLLVRVAVAGSQNISKATSLRLHRVEVFLERHLCDKDMQKTHFL
jgi:hypothetical protein